MCVPRPYKVHATQGHYITANGVRDGLVCAGTSVTVCSYEGHAARYHTAMGVGFIKTRSETLSCYS